jgi:hypothetical protein
MQGYRCTQVRLVCLTSMLILAVLGADAHKGVCKMKDFTRRGGVAVYDSARNEDGEWEDG